MVLCQELSDADYGAAGQPAADLERKFYGFWTFEPGLVQEAVELAIAHIGNYNWELAQKLQSQVQAIAAATAEAKPDDLNAIVSRVVDYLQDSQQTVNNLELCTHHQALDNNLLSNELQAFLRLGQLIDVADTSNPMAAAEVAALAETMGQLLDLPAWQLKRLRLAGLLHRIAPLSVNAQHAEAPSCPLVPAAQVLRTMPRLRAIAQIMNHISEWWNGSGQPAGLAEEEIPLESRILGLVVTFQQRLAQLSKSQAVEKMSETSVLSQALTECRQEQGDRWQPRLVDTLELLVMGLQQGLSLPITPTKISSGIWLIDHQIDEEPGVRSEGRVERMMNYE
jgi:HD-GYP domain-containing protein (c-di-GMP phosphodiesterase class II)